ncbi:MAG TPA: thiamine phosphate synthase [Vicinamibacterales bacterium]|nr:thiamine phosphate synthase [Vicinamibacterales bacterium]
MPTSILPAPLPRLYAILDTDRLHVSGLDPLTLAAVWLDAGVRLFQLRAKTMASGKMLELAEALVRKAEAAGATFIVNDRADIARLAGASGLHVGQTDLDPAAARSVVGADMPIGRSTHTEAQVRAALGEPIDYLAIGPVFGTTSKDRPDPVVGLEGVRMAVRLASAGKPASRAGTGAGPYTESPRPVVAIGGITIDTAPEVIAAGAASVAIIADLLIGGPAARVHDYLHALA